MLNLNQYSLPAKILSLKMTGQVGPRTFQALLAHFETVDKVLMAEKDDLENIEGIGPIKSKAITEADQFLERAQKSIDFLGASETRVISSLEDNYPRSLHELNDPPPLLFYKGRLPGEGEKRVAIVGSQSVSNEGIADAVELAMRLAGGGVSIVSGLARGIDAAGHTGAIKANGITYAVMPSGFDHIYPEEHAGLSKEITVKGGLISEYLPDTPLNTGRLMDRNRLIVGLSQAVVIGEVSTDSVGTLDTALCCHQLGKLLFSVIGENNPHYEKLAGYGAIPLTHIDEYKMVIDSLV